MGQIIELSAYRPTSRHSNQQLPWSNNRLPLHLLPSGFADWLAKSLEVAIDNELVVHCCGLVRLYGLGQEDFASLFGAIEKSFGKIGILAGSVAVIESALQKTGLAGVAKIIADWPPDYSGQAASAALKEFESGIALRRGQKFRSLPEIIAHSALVIEAYRLEYVRLAREQ
jgi:hypothetical protein